MRILHVVFDLPPYGRGGLPFYALGLIEQQLKNNEVFVLKPGRVTGNPKIVIDKLNSRKNLKVYNLNSSMQVLYNFGLNDPSHFIKQYDKKIFYDFLSKIKINIVHVHSFMGIPLEFFEVIKEKNIKIIYTTHDYYGLCLRTNFVNNNVMCTENNKDCTNCNFCKGLSLKKSVILQSFIYKNIKNISFIKHIRNYMRNRLKNSLISNNDYDNIKISNDIRKKYNEIEIYNRKILKCFDFYIFNSELTKQVFEKKLECSGEVIQLLLPDIKKETVDYTVDKYKLSFLGDKSLSKGMNLLIDSIKEDKSYKCIFYGDDFSNISDISLNFINGGFYNRDKLKNIMENTSLLIVPSLSETFGFVVLEALSFGIPVVVSSKVGAKFLFKDCPYDVIFEPNVLSLKECIDNLFENNILEEYRTWILNQDFCFDMSEHEKIIDNIYRSVI